MRQHTISRYHADPVVILVCYVQIANARHFDSIWIIEFGKRGNAIRKSLRAAGISCDQPYDINTKDLTQDLNCTKQKHNNRYTQGGDPANAMVGII